MDEAEPTLRVERGAATAEEVAAITVVLLTTRRPVPAPAPASTWHRRWRSRAGWPAGAGAWRASGLP